MVSSLRLLFSVFKTFILRQTWLNELLINNFNLFRFNSSKLCFIFFSRRFHGFCFACSTYGLGSQIFYFWKFVEFAANFSDTSWALPRGSLFWRCKAWEIRSNILPLYLAVKCFLIVVSFIIILYSLYNNSILTLYYYQFL